MPTRERFYVTTPIYYVNDRPHIGHCYTTLVADAAARFARLAGRPTFFLTGTDEHADKVVTTAAQHGLSAIAWADRNAAEFQAAFEFMGVTHDDFVRTTQDRHKSRVTEYVSALIRSGAIYQGTYEGWYDENQEEYLTETVAKEAGYVSPVTGRPLVRRSEVCYFFKLSKYQEQLERLFAQRPEFVGPQARRNEVLGRLRAGLNDVPISRPVTDDPATRFGIRVPGDDKHRIYVWIDALFNYLSVVDVEARRPFWPADVHLIAKDILWFHAVIWPAMLMALREADPNRFGFVELPGRVYSHAYWVRDGRKMSKSLGNFVTIEVLRAYAGRYGLDALRWYLLTQGPLHEADADFAHAKFVEVYNAELANGIGNSTSRVSNMIAKYFEGRVPDSRGLDEFEGVAWAHEVGLATLEARAVLDTQRLDDALRGGVRLVWAVDQFINATEPFKLAKLDPSAPYTPKRSGAPGLTNLQALGVVLANCAEALRIASLLMFPAMPWKMADLWRRWNCKHLRDPADPNSGFVAPLRELSAWRGSGSIQPGQAIEKGDALFMRADPAEPPPQPTP